MINLFPKQTMEDARRIGVLMPDGMVEMKNFCLTKTGFYPVPTGKQYQSKCKPRVTVQTAIKNNVPILDIKTYTEAKNELIKETGGNIPSEIVKQQKQTNNTMVQNNVYDAMLPEIQSTSVPSAFKVAKQGYQSTVYRAEKGGTINAERTFEITVDATNPASTQSQVIVLGDFSGIHRGVNVINSIQIGVPLGGSFGQDSIPIFRNITGTNPVKINGFLFADTANTPTFFNNGKVRLIRYNVDGSVKSQANIPLSRLKRPDQFNSNIQLLELKAIVDSLSVVEITVPDNSNFVVSIYTEEVADVYGFSEVNA